VTRARVLSQCGWSPFEGETFRSSITATLVNGQVVYREGQLIEAPAAARLQIGPQRTV
jgi:dihydroorotase